MATILDIANSAVSPLFREHYYELMARRFYIETPVLGMIKKDPTATGEHQVHHIPMSTIGGFMAGSIGDAGDAQYLKTSYTTIRLTQAGRIDAKSMELSRDVEGAAKQLASEQVFLMKTEIGRNKERMLVQGDTTGAIGTAGTSAVTDNGGGSYTVLISAATWVRNNWQRRIQINVDSGTSRFVVTAISLTNKSITILRQTGSDVPVDGSVFYMNGSKGNEYMGIKGALSATSGSLYGVTVQDGWQSIQLNANSGPVTADMLIDTVYNVQNETGQTPDMLLLPQAQLKKLVQLGEASKLLTYSDVKGSGNFVMGNTPMLRVGGKEVPLVYSQFMLDSEMFFVNKDHMQLRSLGEGKFIEGQNGGFLHYEGIYLKNDVFGILWREFSTPFIDPRFHARVYGLSTTTVA